MIRLDDSKKFKEMFRKLERKFLKAEQDVFSCSEFTLTECYVLVELGQANGLSFNELSELISIENSAIESAATRLASLGLLENDGDSVSLSESGILLFQKIENSIDCYFANLFTHIPREKRPQVFESMLLILEASTKGTCCGGQSNCFCKPDCCTAKESSGK